MRIDPLALVDKLSRDMNISVCNNKGSLVKRDISYCLLIGKRFPQLKLLIILVEDIDCGTSCLKSFPTEF